MTEELGKRPADEDIANEEERLLIGDQAPELGPDDEELPDELQDPDVEFALTEEDS